MTSRWCIFQRINEPGRTTPGQPVAMRRSSSFRRRGVTLMELLAVMFIITLMASILIGVGSKVRTNAKANQTRVTLANCKAALDEYEVQSQGKRLPHVGVGDGIIYMPINWGQPKARNAPNASGSAVIDDSIERFVWALLRNATTSKMIAAAADPASYRDNDEDGFMELTDAFAGRNRTKLLYLAFVDHDDGYTDDDFLPEKSTPYFASAGPDGEWGNWQDLRKKQTGIAGYDDTLATEAEDNLYSFDLD